MNVANNNKPMNIIDMHVENYAPLSDGGPSNQEKQYYPYSHIGCDETGSGDFFGPLCVVACYIDERDYDWLASLNVRDPKLMTPQEVIEIAREIKDRLVYSLLILDNSHYNQMAVAGNNLANIKAKLYNQAVTNVMQKVAMKVDKKVVNQFGDFLYVRKIFPDKSKLLSGDSNAKKTKRRRTILCNYVFVYSFKICLLPIF